MAKGYLNRNKGSVILIRLSGLPTELKNNIDTADISKHLDEMKGNFTVIGPKRIRIRKIGSWKKL